MNSFDSMLKQAGKRYILKDKEPQLVDDFLTWSLWMCSVENCKVAVTHIADTSEEAIYVSTVFLGMAWGINTEEHPYLFESMVFGGPLSETQRRYTTYEAAEKGHAELVALVKADLSKDVVCKN